jgi:hypothetical protein
MTTDRLAFMAMAPGVFTTTLPVPVQEFPPAPVAVSGNMPSAFAGLPVCRIVSANPVSTALAPLRDGVFPSD